MRCSILQFLSLIALLLLIGYLRRVRVLAFFGETTSFDRPLLLVVLSLFLLIGKQEPITIEGVTHHTQSAPSTLFIIDNSLSMTVRDTVEGASRIAIAKQLLDLLLKGQDGAWVALGTQNGDFEWVAPLTIDIPLTRLMLNEVPLATTGTDFLRGFGTLSHLLQQSPRPSQVVLVSDGEPIPPMDAQQRASLTRVLKELDIPLYTVGIGSVAGGIIPEINKLSVPDFDLLAQMAQEGGGTFYRVGEAGLIELSETIQGNFVGQPSDTGLERVVRRMSPYFYLLAALFFLLALRLNPR